jgi:hypothetical protein
MADEQSNAPLRASAGTRNSGVIHVRTRMTADFIVIANALAQRPGSAVTVGVAVYILSLPDGAPVSIAALCAHFTEGEILISRALRELEAAGYLERRRERGADGRVRTRTFAYDLPGGGAPAPPPPRKRVPVAPGDRPRGTLDRPRQPQPKPLLTPVAPDTGPGTDTDPRAVAVLAALRGRDPRLILSEREVAELAPAVTVWLERGVPPHRITEALTVGLPAHFTARPVRLLAFRLAGAPAAVPGPTPAPTPAAVPGPVGEPGAPVVLPFQTCDGCDRAFRAAAPGSCRDCRSDDRPAAPSTQRRNRTGRYGQRLRATG